MASRQVRIPWVFNLNYHRFKDEVTTLAHMAGVSTQRYEEFNNEGHVFAVTIEVISDDKGSVDDFCNSFLIPVAQEPTYNQLSASSSFYHSRLEAWYKAQQPGIVKRLLRRVW